MACPHLDAGTDRSRLLEADPCHRGLRFNLELSHFNIDFLLDETPRLLIMCTVDSVDHTTNSLIELNGCVRVLVVVSESFPSTCHGAAEDAQSSTFFSLFPSLLQLLAAVVCGLTRSVVSIV